MRIPCQYCGQVHYSIVQAEYCSRSNPYPFGSGQRILCVLLVLPALGVLVGALTHWWLPQAGVIFILYAPLVCGIVEGLLETRRNMKKRRAGQSHEPEPSESSPRVSSSS